jgi:hypothetical protein
MGGPCVAYSIDGEFIIPSHANNAVVEGMPIQEIYRINLTFHIADQEFYSLFTNPNRPGYRPGTTGQATLQMPGFQKPNEFYSPKYTLENITTKQPDYRPTLFWSPSVAVEDGKATVSFFTCDNLSDYAIFVEGITKNGNILSGVKQFSVTEFNPAKE